MKFALTIFFIGYYFFTNAPQRSDWNKYNLQFIEDSISSFNTELVKHSIIKNIKKSKAIIEIRVTNQGRAKNDLNAGNVYALEFFPDSFKTEKTRYVYGKLNNIDVYTKAGYIVIPSLDYNKILINQNTKNHNSSEFDSIFQNLIYHNLLTAKDQTNLIDSLIKNKVVNLKEEKKVHTFDCSAGLYFIEVKVQNRFRNFYLSGGYTCSDVFDTIQDFKLNNILFEILNKLFKN